MPLSVADGQRLIEVEAQLRRLEQGGVGTTPSTAWTFQTIEDRINAEEAKYPNIPRGLAKAVAYQESAYNPEARGDGGQAQGLFQLHKGAAIDAGIDPARRGEPALNIPGGVKYLSLKIAQAKGDIPTALSLYNRGTPDYRGIGDPNYIQNVYKHYKPPAAEKPGLLARVSSALAPASAEAATPQTAGRSRLEEIEAELARREAVDAELARREAPQAPTEAPAPPTARSTPEQDAAYRASRGQQEPSPAPQTTPATSTQPGASQGPPMGDLLARFDALPSVRSWSPADRAARRREFAALTPDLQEEFLRSEEPPSDLVVDIEKPSTPQAGAAGAITPAELDAALTRELAPAQQGMTGLLLGGAAGTAGRAVGQLAQRALPWLGRAAGILPVAGEAAGSYGGRQANVALGNEQPGTVGDVLSAAVPVAARAIGAIAPALVRRLPGAAGAQHELMAERLRAQPAAQAPPTTAATLYRAVAQQGNPAIPAQHLRQTAQDLLTAEMRHGASLRNPTIVGVARDIDALAAQYPQGIPMDRLYETMQRVGEMVGAARRSGGTETRALNRLYAGLHEALENAAQTNIPGAATLRQAIAASRQEHAVRRLGRIVGQGRGIEEQTATGYTFVKGKKMLNEFDRLVADDDVFRGSFTGEQLQEMRALFQEASRLPALPTPSGTPRGSGAAATRAALGSLFGGPAGAAIAVSGHEIIAQAMMTAPGRAMLRAALEGRGGLTPQALAVLQTALREQLPAEQP